MIKNTRRQAAPRTTIFVPRPLGKAVALACCGIALGLSLPDPASAQTPGTQAQPASRNYSISAGPLAPALRNLAGSAGVALTFTPEQTAGKTTAGLRGQYTAQQAFAALLAGTDLQAVLQGNGGYALRVLPVVAPTSGDRTLDTVKVEASADLPGSLPKAYAGGQVARGGQVGLLGNKDIMDTPFNVTHYTQQTMQDQQVRSVADVVVNDPSVRNINPSGGRFDQFSMRGFRIINSDIAFGGLYGMLSSYSVAVEMAERAEVLKGPNALLNGMSPNGAVGGGINLVPKRADDRPLTQFTASYASAAQFGGHLDVGRRFGPDNSVGVRFNGAYRNGDVAVDKQAQELGLGELGLDFRGERLRLSADLGHQERLVDAPLERVKVASTLAVPRAPDADRNFAQPWTYTDTRDSHVVLRGEYDLTPEVTAYAAAGARRGRYDFLSHQATVSNALGDFTYTPSRYLRNEDNGTAEAGLRARFETGPVRHALNLNASLFRLEVRDRTQNFAASSSNLYKPVVRAAPTLADLGNPPKTSDKELSSLALADTLSVLEDRLQLTLGARHQRVRAEAFNAASGATTSRYDEHAVTPALGLVVKVRPNVSLYANYIEGLTQGPTAPTTAANAGEVFAPYKSKQVEAGAKVDFGSITTTLSVFQIEQPSALTNTDTNVFGLDGEQRNRGVELNVFGELRRGVRLLGGVMLLDSELVKTAGGTSDGKQAPGVPRVNLNLGGEWDTPFIPGLTLNARAIHTDSQYLSAANTQELPSWTRYDLGARYHLKAGNTPLTIRATIENLFDKNYWAASPEGLGIALGAPRTVLLSATVDL